jgi:hypothetical protein
MQYAAQAILKIDEEIAEKGYFQSEIILGCRIS